MTTQQEAREALRMIVFRMSDAAARASEADITTLSRYLIDQHPPASTVSAGADGYDNMPNETILAVRTESAGADAVEAALSAMDSYWEIPDEPHGNTPAGAMRAALAAAFPILTREVAELRAKVERLKKQGHELIAGRNEWKALADEYEAALREAREDSARLDWLQANELTVTSHRENSDVEYFIWWTVVRPKKMTGESVSGHPLGSPREAIDAARAATREPT